MFRNTAIAAGLLIVNIGAASAVPITWTLQDFAFVDGGTASGMFDFDADTGQVSNIDIITTAGTILPGETFQFNIDFGDRFFLFTSEPTSDAGSVPAFSFLLASSLTNAGGTIAVESGSEGAGPPDGIQRFIASGSLTTISEVPLPAAAWMFLAGLGGLSAARRKKRAKNSKEL